MTLPVTTKQFLDANQDPVEYDGSPLSWRVSAYVLVQKEDQLLIIKNKREKLYDIIGGGIEFGETIEEALAREAQEEGGVVVTIGELLHANVGWFYHRNGNYYQTLQLFYAASAIEEAEPTDPDIEWCGWVDLSQIGSDYRLPAFVEHVIKEKVSK